MPQAIPVIQAAASAAATFFTSTAGIVTLTAVSVAGGALAAQALGEAQDVGSANQALSLDFRTDRPFQAVIGERATAGSFVAAFAHGDNNRDISKVICLADHECAGMVEIEVGGVVVWSGTAVHGVKTLIPYYSSGGERAWFTWYDGREGQTADANLVADTAAIPYKWTSTAHLKGKSYVIFKYRYDSDTVTQDLQPIFRVRGAKHYDRRKDGTAGGVGAHRWNDPTTWEYSKNPAVVLDHYQLGRVYKTGGDEDDVIFGPGLDAAMLPYDEFEAAADICDEQVALKGGGTQDRYSINGFYDAGEPYATVVERIGRHMVSEAIDVGGVIYHRPAQARAPVATITDSDLLLGVPTTYTPSPGQNEIVNTIRGNFVNPDQGFRATEYPEVTDAAWIAADGDIHPSTQDFEMETNSERAQRLARIYAEKFRRRATIGETYGPEFRFLEPGDWITRDHALRGFPVEGKTFEILTRRIDQDGNITVTAIETDPDVFSHSVDNIQDITIPAPFPSLVLVGLPTPAVTVTPVSYTFGDTELPAIDFDDVIPAGADLLPTHIEIEYGFSNGLAPPNLAITGRPGLITAPLDAADVKMIIGLLPSRDYAIRFRYRLGDRKSNWQDYQEFTTTAIYQAGTAGVADSIVGQGWGATATEDEASNLVVQNLIQNRLPTDFRSYPQEWTASLSGSAIDAPDATGFTRVGGTVRRSLTGGFTWLLTKALIKNVEGEKYKLRVHYSFPSFPSQATGTPALSIFFRSQDSDNVYIANRGFVTGNWTGVSKPPPIEVEITGVSADHWLRPGLYVRSELTAGIIQIDSIEVYVPGVGWSHLSTVEIGADVTGNNVADSVVDQGALATLNNVGTGQILSNAVTGAVSNTNDAQTSPANNTWTTVISRSITTTGGNILILAAAYVAGINVGSPGYTEFQIIRGTDIVRRVNATIGIFDGGSDYITGGNVTLTDIDAPPAGTYTYSLQVRFTNCGSQRICNNKSIFITEFKR